MHFLSNLTRGLFVSYCGRILLALSLAIVGICIAPEVHGQTKSDEGKDENKKEKGITLIEAGTRPLATLTFSRASRFVDEAS